MRTNRCVHCVFQATQAHSHTQRAIRQWQRRATVIPLWFIDFFEYVQLVVNRAKDLLRCVPYYSCSRSTYPSQTPTCTQQSLCYSHSLSCIDIHTHTFPETFFLHFGIWSLRKHYIATHIRRWQNEKDNICNIISVMWESTWEHKESLELLVFSLRNTLSGEGKSVVNLYNFRIHCVCLYSLLSSAHIRADWLAFLLIAMEIFRSADQDHAELKVPISCHTLPCRAVQWINNNA